MLTREEYDAALAELERLMDETPPGPPGVGDEIIRLADLCEEYELVHFPIPEPTPEEAAAFRAEQERRNG